MSRTYRKRPMSYEAYWKRLISQKLYTYSKKNKNEYYSDKTNKWYSWGMPHEYRNMVNRCRRAKDKAELHKELSLEDYAGLYSRWNCKDNQSWGYW